MKKQVNKLALNKVTVNQLDTNQEAVKGGITPFLVTVVLTLLVCNPPPAGSSKDNPMSGG